MAPTFKLVAGAPKADLLVVPVFAGARLGPGADLVDDAIGGTLAEFMQETDFDGKRGEVLAVPTGGRLGARAALLLGVGDADTFDAAAIRRAGAVLAKRARAWSRRSRPRCSTRSAPDVDPRARRAGVRGRRVSRPLPVPALQVGGEGVASCSACSSSAAVEREGARRARARRAHRGGGRVGARPHQRARGREVAGRRRRPRPKDRGARVGLEGEGVRGRAARAGPHGRRARRRQRLRPSAPVPAARVRARRRARARSRSSARVWCSTPAACRSRPRAAWRR